MTSRAEYPPDRSHFTAFQPRTTDAVLSALAVGIHYDVPLDEAIRALTDMPYLPGRMTPLNGLNNSMLIDDTYDATPQSNLAVMDWFQAVNAERAPESRHPVEYVIACGMKFARA